MPSRPLAWLLSILAISSLGGTGLWLAFDPPTRQTWIDLAAEIRQTDPTLGAWHRSHLIGRALDRHNERLTREATLARALRPRWQAALARLGAGNETVYVGRRGFLELREAVDAVLGPKTSARAEAEAPGPELRAALREFAAELEGRGIALWVLPLPSKVTVEPTGFGGRAPPPLHPPAFAAFVDDLKAAGIRVFDPTPILVEFSPPSGQTSKYPSPAYLRTDSHWQPAAMAEVAAELAAALEKELALAPASRAWSRTPRKVTAQGDLVRLLEMKGTTLFPPEDVEIAMVTDAAGQFFAPEAGAEILLLGDSFTNVFSDESLGWGQAAGLAEQLAFALQRPIDRIAVNGGGPLGARDRLRDEQHSGRDRLQGKKVVVLQLATRDLDPPSHP